MTAKVRAVLDDLEQKVSDAVFEAGVALRHLELTDDEARAILEGAGDWDDAEPSDPFAGGNEALPRT